MASVSVPAERPGGLLRRPHATTGFWSWFTTVDHKKIGILYGITAFAFFLIGGSRGVADPRAARAARPDLPRTRGLQRAVHDARHHDGVPRGDAAVGGVLQLPAAAHDRRARRRVPAPERVQLLGVPVRRAVHLLELVPGRRAERGVVRLRAELRDRPLAGDDVLRDRAPDRRDRVDGLGRQPRRDDPQHAGTRHDAVPDAGVRLDGAGRAAPARVQPAGDHDRPGRAAVRPAVRDALLRRRRGRQPRAVAAPVLAVRPPRGLHPGPAGDGDRVRDPAGVRAQAAVRLPVRRVQRDRDRVHRVRRVGAPHVRGRPRAGGEHGVRGLDDDHRDPDRREDLQLARDAVERRPALRDARCCSRSGSSRCS